MIEVHCSPNLSITYDDSSSTLTFQGTLRYAALTATDAQGMQGLFSQALARKPSKVTLNLTALNSIDGPGFQELLKFVARTNRFIFTTLAVYASRSASWQAQRLPGLRKYHQSYELQFVD